MECFCYLRNDQDSLADRKTPKGQTHFSEAMVEEEHPISARDQSRIHKFFKKSVLGIFLGCELATREDIWKGDLLTVDLEGSKSWMHQKCVLERINAKEILIRQKMSERNYEFRESTLGREPTVRCEDLSGELHDENGESLNRQNPQMTLKAVPVSGRSQVTSSIVVTTNLGFNSKCRRRKHALFQLKYMDVTWSIHIDLDVLQEKRIDDHWNADLNRHLSDSWRGFTKFHFLQGKPPTAYMWSGW